MAGDLLLGVEKMTVKEAYKRLEDAFNGFAGQESWEEYLKFSSKFKGYSLNNTIMIYLQNPDARFIRGYKSWQKLDRQVKKGSRGIRIFAPLTYHKKKDEVDAEQTYLAGFRMISVFDLSQTEGDDDQLPVMLTGLRSSEDYTDMMHRIIEISPVPVELYDMGFAGHGCYYTDKGMIRINSRSTSTQNLKTLFHELGHHYCRSLKEKYEYSREEFVVESAAYLICCMLGIDTGEYAIPYLKSWFDDFKGFQTMRKSIETITKRILEVVEDELREVSDEREEGS
jgi:antirestriction protein ArdC